MSLAVLDSLDPPVLLRAAVAADLPDLVRMLAADSLGSSREGDPSDPEQLEPYRRAFAEIDADPAHLLLVAEAAGTVVGTLQLSVLPGLARRGAPRAQIEAVRVGASMRGRGLGELMLRWCIDEARRRGCRLVQLTTDKSRADAHRFYRRLGFVASHEGMKLTLD